jgi:hypothetical protein
MIMRKQTAGKKIKVDVTLMTTWAPDDTEHHDLPFLKTGLGVIRTDTIPSCT